MLNDNILGSLGAAGYDLYSAQGVTIEPHRSQAFDTGIAISLPPDTYGQIASRSSLALLGIAAVGGVIDRDFRSSINVVLFNHGTVDYKVCAGDRIAQLIIHRICHPHWMEVDTLEPTVRGSGAFGSTGR